MQDKPQIINYLYGLGGREIDVLDIEKILLELLEVAESEEVPEKFKYVHIRD